ncbi:hypothetical protein PG993_006197 [Apiospora rasikravindrae]|uniref:F-box domain-containing protein n=1 Tax=Apiospora rasikravindrae TaxID=990691 RepID=A0ABR1T748_9PEZI
MDRIPTEIKLAIVRMLIEDSPESAYVYATLSREWQALLEPTTFASLKLNQVRLCQAKGTLTPVRQAYVRRIHFTALLPDYDYHHRPDNESEKQRNNEAFSDAVASLMDLLGAWSSPHHGGIELQLSTACTIDLQTMRRGHGFELLNLRARQIRCISSYVTLNKGFYRQLPELPCISKFTCPPASVYQRRLVPQTCCQIASRFPHLRTIDWQLADGSHNSDFRLQLRSDFATGLLAFIPELVRHFTLGYSRGPGVERFFPDEDPQICLGSTRDPLSVALRNLSMQMETVTLQMTSIGSELLWDPELPPDQQGCWPRLREMGLNFDGRTPQGEELFDWDPSDLPDPDDHESDPPSAFTRVIPIPAQHRPYHLAFARAAGRMPRLRYFSALYGYRLAAMVDYTVRPRTAEFHYESSPVVDGLITQEVQEEWWNNAHAHLREGDKFRFHVVDTEEIVGFRHRAITGIAIDDPPERKTIKWTRVI